MHNPAAPDRAPSPTAVWLSALDRYRSAHAQVGCVTRRSSSRKKLTTRAGTRAPTLQNGDLNLSTYSLPDVGRGRLLLIACFAALLTLGGACGGSTTTKLGP